MSAKEELTKSSHEQKIQNKDTDIKCKLCGNTYKTEKMFQKHMNTKHEGYKTCKHCSKCFKNADTLETHMKTVNNQKKKRNISYKRTNGLKEIIN